MDAQSLREIRDHFTRFPLRAQESAKVGDLNAGAVTVRDDLTLLGRLVIKLTGRRSATTASAGTNGDIPAEVVGYIAFEDESGTRFKIPYFAD